MKILEIMPDFKMAGAEIMVENLSYYLKGKTELKVISMYRCETAITKRMSEQNIDLVFLDKHPGFDKNVIKKLRKIINEFRPDIIHTHRYMLLYALLAAGSWKKCKIFHTVHNVAQKEVPAKLQMIQKYIFKRKIATPIAISPIVKDTIIEHYRLQPDDVPMIYNGVNTDRFYQKENYDKHIPFCCLHIGRFSEQKNHEIILRAIYKLKEKGLPVRCIFLGEGELLSHIQLQAKTMELSDQIYFAGIVSDVRCWMNKADVFILPSKWEGMPITLIEAMSSGMPIIASAVGGVPDMIINEKNGMLISPNAEELVNAILRLQDVELRKKIGTQASKDAKKFDVQTMGEQYFKLFKGEL